MGSRHRSHSSADYSALGERIRIARLKVGLTQVQLADRINQTQSFVGKVERGERQITALELRDMCRVFGIPSSAILDDLKG